MHEEMSYTIRFHLVGSWRRVSSLLAALLAGTITRGRDQNLGALWGDAAAQRRDDPQTPIVRTPRGTFALRHPTGRVRG